MHLGSFFNQCLTLPICKMGTMIASTSTGSYKNLNGISMQRGWYRARIQWLHPLIVVAQSPGRDSLQPHWLQHSRPPCPSPSPEVCPSSCPLHQWCHPAISCSDALFSICPQSFLASRTLVLSHVVSNIFSFILWQLRAVFLIQNVLTSLAQKLFWIFVFLFWKRFSAYKLWRNKKCSFSYFLYCHLIPRWDLSLELKSAYPAACFPNIPIYSSLASQT